MQNPASLTVTPKTASDRLRSEKSRSRLRPFSKFQDCQLFYQPVFGLSDSRLLGFEVILEQNAPEPNAVEENPSLEALKWRALEQICWQFRQWQDQFPQANSLVLHLALFSSAMLRSPGKKRADEILARYRIAGTQIRLELTDGTSNGTSPPGTPFRIQRYFNDLCSQGLRLSSLYQCPTGTLKIKARFINDRQWSILQGLLALAADLDLEAIAEEVENETDLARIEALAGFALRGYTRSQRLIAEEATALITRQGGITPPRR